ncbi:MAG: hypothetical protein GXP63_00770 [DPANN group archaeon]|nr:hypothetical protein [DPANN group archaeon]
MTTPFIILNIQQKKNIGEIAEAMFELLKRSPETKKQMQFRSADDQDAYAYASSRTDTDITICAVVSEQRPGSAYDPDESSTPLFTLTYDVPSAYVPNGKERPKIINVYPSMIGVSYEDLINFDDVIIYMQQHINK